MSSLFLEIKAIKLKYKNWNPTFEFIEFMTHVTLRKKKFVIFIYFIFKTKYYVFVFFLCC